MKAKISDHFIDYYSVKEIWDPVDGLYSQEQDESQIADLNNKAMELVREHRSISVYSAELTKLCNEIYY